MGQLAADNTYELPDVGPPLIPPGGQFSPGVGFVNRAVEAWGAPRPPRDESVVFPSAISPYLNITEGDLGRGMDAAMGVSGGGLKTAPVPHLGQLADPRGGSGNWFIRHVEGKPIMSDEGTHGFSGLRTGKTPDQMSYKIEGAPTPQRQTWDIANLEGKDLIFGVKDRTAGGGLLTDVGGRKLRNPVAMEAGADYSYLHEGVPLPPGYDKDAARIFASASKAAASKLNNEALRSLEAGRDPIFTSMAMARGAGDSAKQTAATAYQVAKQSRPSEATVELIDKQMRANMAAEKVKTETPFPGFGSGKLGAWLDENGLKARGAFVRALDTKGARAGGVPDIGEVRYANTDPRLRTTPTGSSGLFMARMRPELEAAGVDSLHSNYPATILGSKADRGGLAGSVPFHVIAPDLHRQLLAAGEPRFFANNPAQLVMTNMPTGISKTQTVTPEVVDRVSEFFRKYPKGFAYAGGVPALGALASQDKYEGQ